MLRGENWHSSNLCFSHSNGIFPALQLLIHSHGLVDISLQWEEVGGKW